MGFFSGKDAELRTVPLTPYQKQAVYGMMDLLKTPTLPQRQVAGMSSAEQASQGVLSSILSGASFQDPRSSDLYRGLRNESLTEETRGVDALRRRAQLGGMFNSGTSLAGEGQYRQGMANNRLSLLGGLYDQERARDNPYTRLAAGAQYGALPRQIEQAGMDTAYQNAMAPIEFQYGPLMQALQALFGMAPTSYMTAPEPSMFSQMAPLLGDIAQSSASMFAPTPGGMGGMNKSGMNKSGIYAGKM
jgi:hypothetical protein